MRLPIKNKQPSHILSLPDLAGGLNMRDGLSEVLDNQLTDCENMWWHEGVLKTRPGLYQNKTQIKLDKENGIPLYKIRCHNCYNTVTGIKGQLCSIAQGEKIIFFWNYGNTISQIQPLKEFAQNYFVCQYSNKLYCFTTNRKIYSYNIALNDLEEWKEVTESEMYIPTVMMQCKKHKSADISSEQISGVMLEGYNVLSNYYKMSYNSYNPDIVTEDNQKHPMQYHVLKNITGYNGYVFKVEFNYNGKVYTHQVTISGGVGKETTCLEDGLRIEVWKNRVTFFDKNNTIATISNKQDANATITSTGEDDIVITAPYIWSLKEKEKIFNMTQCEWFGGSAGLAGGTRLFLCGNSKANNADLVIWSGLNNPLYFPENSYFYVGNETGAVTGFGKQSDKLIIFKENETWFTQYVQNTSITAADLVNQNVIDFASSSVYFPLTLINSNIGCPYPDTIQLCRNRLVWLGNNNNVYSLVSDNQYNERSVLTVSEMVKRKIQELAPKSSSSITACDWNGYYCLFIGDDMLLMDYNSYGYTYIAGHSKTEDANVRIPWYCWKIGKGKKMMTIGDVLSLVDIENKGEEYFINSYRFDLKENVDKSIDTQQEIYSSFTTKMFDFGLPHIRKNIEQINVQLGNNGGEEILVHIVTENGIDETVVFTDGKETQNYTAAYITSRALYPCIKQVIKMGLKLKCKGCLAVDSLIIKYRITTGGAR